MIATLLSLVLAQAPAAAAETAMTDGAPVAMTRAEIREYNAKLDRNHPAYIRCMRTLDTGSLVKKTTSCRTNAEWKRSEEVGNSDARDTMDRMESGSWRTSDDPKVGG
jgi:hypothetical protein